MSISDASLSTANVIYTFAWYGLIIGAVLTAISTFAIFWASGIRDKYSDQQIEQASVTGEQARRDAAAANARAGELSKEAHRIRQENLRLSIDLEEAKAAHATLQGKIASRSLTAEQSERLVGRLKSQSKLIVSFIRLGDKEANEYATQILNAMREAGVDIRLFDIGTYAPPVYGVIVNHGEGSDDLADALANAGIEVLRVTDDRPLTSILVGLKPPKL
jgi:hypothetical protein